MLQARDTSVRASKRLRSSLSLGDPQLGSRAHVAPAPPPDPVSDLPNTTTPETVVGGSSLQQTSNTHEPRDHQALSTEAPHVAEALHVPFEDAQLPATARTAKPAIVTRSSAEEAPVHGAANGSADDSVANKEQAPTLPPPSEEIRQGTSSAEALTTRKRRSRPSSPSDRAPQEPENGNVRATAANRTPSQPEEDQETQAMRKVCATADDRGIVWTKIKGHPYWPAQMVALTPQLSAETRFAEASRFRRRTDDTCVQYFGTLEIAFVQKAKCCISWKRGIDMGLHKTQRKRVMFHRALDEVRGFCARMSRFPRGWWSEPRCLKLSSEFLARCTPAGHPEHDAKRASSFSMRKFVATAQLESIGWAKVRGFPHWPVQILPVEVARTRFPMLKLGSPAQGEAAADSTGPSSLPCMFFGTGEVACIPQRCFTSLEEGIKMGYAGESDRVDFRTGLGEMFGYLSSPREWPTGYRSGRSWWNAPETETNDVRNVVIRVRTENGDTDEEAEPIPDLPEYEYLRRSVWPDGDSPPPRPRRSDIPICSCPPRASGACTDGGCLNFVSRVICDPNTCPAQESCRNIAFNRRKKPDLKPFFTNDGRGWGLKAHEDIPKGSFVVEYVGEIIDQYECEKRLKQVQRRGDSEYYMMEISADHVLDASRKGNLSRFINSSCSPNCATQKWTDAATGQTRVGIFTISDIPAGTEVTYNYCFQDFGLASKKGKRAFVCRCGSPNCASFEEGEYDRQQRMVGLRIKVRWDDGWYLGVVKSYDLVSKLYTIEYDDGDKEQLSLGEKPDPNNVQFKLLSRSDGASR